MVNQRGFVRELVCILLFEHSRECKLCSRQTQRPIIKDGLNCEFEVVYLVHLPPFDELLLTLELCLKNLSLRQARWSPDLACLQQNHCAKEANRETEKYGGRVLQINFYWIGTEYIRWSLELAYWRWGIGCYQIASIPITNKCEI